MAYKSKYNPENSDKYVGNPNNIICRSTWERKMCKYLDKNVNVLRWASEELSIPYVSPIDKKHHKYYPDFLAEIKQKSGSVQTFIIEIKPEKQTKPPKTKNKKTKTHNINMKTFVINHAKWKAAEKFCSDNDWKFTVLTEKHLFKGNKWG